MRYPHLGQLVEKIKLDTLIRRDLASERLADAPAPTAEVIQLPAQVHRISNRPFPWQKPFPQTDEEKAAAAVEAALDATWFVSNQVELGMLFSSLRASCCLARVAYIATGGDHRLTFPPFLTFTPSPSISYLLLPVFHPSLSAAFPHVRHLVTGLHGITSDSWLGCEAPVLRTLTVTRRYTDDWPLPANERSEARSLEPGYVQLDPTHAAYFAWLISRASDSLTTLSLFLDEKFIPSFLSLTSLTHLSLNLTGGFNSYFQFRRRQPPPSFHLNLPPNLRRLHFWGDAPLAFPSLFSSLSTCIALEKLHFSVELLRPSDLLSGLPLLPPSLRRIKVLRAGAEDDGMFQCGTSLRWKRIGRRGRGR
ncbi:hypothetical protein JCM8547_006405 [Rhodosporidiobolus lusitaniae]